MVLRTGGMAQAAMLPEWHEGKVEVDGRFGCGHRCGDRCAWPHGEERYVVGPREELFGIDHELAAMV